MYYVVDFRITFDRRTKYNKEQTFQIPLTRMHLFFFSISNLQIDWVLRSTAIDSV